MFEYLFWQIGQLFKPFPDPESWKYRFLTWLYDREYGSEDELDIPDINLEPSSEEEGTVYYNIKFPAEFNAVIFDVEDTDVVEKYSRFVIQYAKEFLVALESFERAAEAVKAVGLSIEELELKVKELEVNNDHDERVPEGWEPVYAFDDDPDTLIGLVDPDGRVHDKRDIIYDDPEPTA